MERTLSMDYVCAELQHNQMKCLNLRVLEMETNKKTFQFLAKPLLFFGAMDDLQLLPPAIFMVVITKPYTKITTAKITVCQGSCIRV